MSDEQFDQYMQSLRDGKETLVVYAPNHTEEKAQPHEVVKLCRELGFETFQQLELTDEKTGRRYITPRKYPILRLPMRRQNQTRKAKIGIPAHNHTIDELTGQVAGESKGSSFGLPQLHVARARNLPRMAEELLKPRGGDEEAYRMMEQSIEQQGGFDLDKVSTNLTKVKSTETINVFLRCMMLEGEL